MTQPYSHNHALRADSPVPPDSYFLFRALPDPTLAANAGIAFGKLRQYVAFAPLQYARVEEMLGIANRAHPEATSLPAFPDIHFYFIIWDTIFAMIDLLCMLTRFEAAGKVRRKHLKVFEHYRMGRDDFEHFNERLPGSTSKKARPLLVGPEPGEAHGVVVSGEMSGSLEVWRSGVVRGDAYEFAGRAWDIGRGSLDQLLAITTEFIAAFRADARQLAADRDATSIQPTEPPAV